MDDADIFRNCFFILIWTIVCVGTVSYWKREREREEIS